MNTISLLNCFYREDVITDLISNLINNEENFVKWFIETICNLSIHDAIAVAHTRVGLGKNLGIPDLVVEIKINSVTGQIIVIENKLGALEGKEQTNRYASSEAQSKLRAVLNINGNTPIRFMFLPLDPYTPAENPAFEKKDYRCFLNVDWTKVIKDNAARQVMNDYSTMLGEFYEPILTAKITDEIHIAKKLDSLQKKLLWIKILQEVQTALPNQLEMRIGEAGGSGRNSAVFLFSKKGWQRNYFDGKELSADSLDVHFELSIDLLEFTKVNSFALHYEPYPYQAADKYSGVMGYNEYVDLRKRRYEHLHNAVEENVQKGFFNLRRGTNSILRINIKENEQFIDVINELVKRMGELIPLVESILDIY